MSPATSTVSLILFDVNETLADLRPLRKRIEQVGASADLLELWFASTLRDGFALAAAGAFVDFETVALGDLSGLLEREGSADPGRAAEHVVAGFRELDLHPDIDEGIRKLAAAGIRMATLTNGSAQLTAALLERAGLAGLVERHLSVDEVRRWKPAPDPYLHSVRALGAHPTETMLIAVHPWDVDGAKRAGVGGG